MKTIFFSLFFIIMLSLTTLVEARPDSISKQQAIDIATQIYPGRVLAVKHISDYYQVKILSDRGKVKIIRIDEHSGSQLQPKHRR